MPVEPARNPDVIAFADYLTSHRHFAVVAHPRMDADALGSVLGFVHALEASGRKAQAFTQGPYPGNIRFLPGSETVIEWTGRDCWPHDWNPEVLIVCDIGSYSRVEGFVEGLKHLYMEHGHLRDDRPFRIANIDHHPSNEGFGDVSWIEATASSTAEMAWDVLAAAKLPVTTDVAWNLFAGIMGDTGSFNYSNTSPRAMHIAASLVEAGADPDTISREHYRSVPIGELKLHARILDRLQTAAEGRLAWSYVTQADLTDLELPPTGASDLVNLVTQLDGAQIAVLFSELDHTGGPTRLSLRGKGYHNLNEVARSYGGGGHARAAGATVHRRLEEVMPDVTRSLAKMCDGEPEQKW